MVEQSTIECYFQFRPIDEISARVFIGANNPFVPESLLKNNVLGGWLKDNYPSWRVDNDSMAVVGAYVVDLGINNDQKYPFIISVALRRQIQ